MMANHIQKIASQLVSPQRNPTADEIQYMCRICSQSEVSINAFSDLGKVLNLEEKIKTCLRLELQETGPYPNNVCMNCLGKVFNSHELFLTAKSTQEKIRLALTRAGIIPNVPVPPVTNGSTTSNGPLLINNVHSVAQPQTNPVQRVPNPTPLTPIKTIKTEPQLPTTPTSGKRPAGSDFTPPKKERKTVCSTCGEWFLKSELAAHTQQVHQSVKLVYGCVNCSSNFMTQEELTAHSETCL